MSCQQASRFITNNSNHNSNNNNNISSSNIIKENRLQRAVQQEDPYVFTESVPTTPPILFNTQKTRTRLNDITSTTTTLSVGKLQQQQPHQQQQQKLPLTETNGKIAPLNAIKTQASLVAAAAASATTTTTITPTIKNVTQSLTTAAATATSQLHSVAAAAVINNTKKLTNVCIVRPQLQQQQPPYYHHHQQQQHLITSNSYEGDLKSISPPPLYTPPTPSLWQTPLLLETSAAATTAAVVNVSLPPPAPPSSSATPQVANVAPQPIIITTQNSSIVGYNTTTTVQTVGNTTMNSMNPPSLTTTTNTTAMAKVAPIIIHHSTHPLTPQIAHTPPSPPTSPGSLIASSLQNANQCLPPSNFHNHTLAHHLQKVECLKKSKKLNQQPEYVTCNTISVKQQHSIHPSLHTPTPNSVATSVQLNDCISSSPVKHSDNEDLNEIPVNVIFRMALVPQQQQQQQQHQQPLKNQDGINDGKSFNNLNKFAIPATINSNMLSTTSTITSTTVAALSSSPSPPQIKSNVNKKCSLPASKINQILKQKPQINTSSIQQQQQQQQQQHIATNIISKLSQQQLQLQLQPQLQQEQPQPHHESKIPNLEPLAPQPEQKSISIPKSKHLTHTVSKPSRKLNTSLTNLICSDLPSYKWQMGGCSTTKGAVAIIKMSQYNMDLDTSHLATAAGLPYCIQHHWLTTAYDFCKSPADSEKPINRSLAREERITLYRQQLRRQAMQLLSTRSLQKLPLRNARRRILCVDRLIKKYQLQHNEKELPANVKRCCINGCDAYTLEMASHCQRHIVYNAAQHIFLPCTAKFADNTQCRVPVFDINHDLPLCMEHARKRDAYNRLLYEQRPRKISAPPNQQTTIIMSGVGESARTTTSKISGGKLGGGVILKTKNYQQQSQQQQLQQHQQQQQFNLQQLPTVNKRATLVNQQQTTRKRKINVAGGGCVGVGNPVGRPQKRVKKQMETATATIAKTTQPNQHPLQHQMPRLTSTNLKRKSSTTSLESIATSNSQHSTTSSTSQQALQHQQQHQIYEVTTTTTSSIPTTNSSSTSLPPPALAPLSSGLMMGHHHHNHHHHGLPQHLFSFGHDNHHHHPISNNNDKHSFSSSASSTTPTELKDIISQFSFAAHKNKTIVESTDLLNTNSNSNFTSSGMGSTTSLPTADDFLTQDMLSICENSSASSADTGLGGLSDPELMLGGPEDDIPLGDTHLLEEHDLANVLNSLPEDAFKELFTAVHQDESDEIERAIELADKQLKRLQQNIGSELGDFLDFNDDMLMENSDMCNDASTVSANNNELDASTFFIGGVGGGGVNATTISGTVSLAGVGGAGSADIRGLVQT